MIQGILFYFFASLVTLSAIMVISVKNPVHSVLFLIFTFFNAAGLFILLGAEFLAMLIVIVYVGAVAVLFLFVVMMLNINFTELKSGMLKYLPLGLVMAVLLFIDLYLIIKASVKNVRVISELDFPNPSNLSNTHAIGKILYIDYFYPFQLAGIVLLVAMIGTIVLTLRKKNGVKKQDVAQQIERNKNNSIKILNVKKGAGIDV